MPAPPPTTNFASDPAIDIDLKDPRLAAFLAWLVPGLGHLYQGRRGKGVLFFVCIVGTFVYGLWLGGGRVVYASVPSPLTRWQYFCQLGVGLPALPAIVQRERIKDGKEQLVADWFMRPPRMVPPPNQPEGFTSTDQSGNTVHHPDEAAQWNHDYGDMFELGTVFTVIAGLLNLLVIFDAYGGPLVLPPHDGQQHGNKPPNTAADAKS
jgi:hypothetical protein